MYNLDDMEQAEIIRNFNRAGHECALIEQIGSGGQAVVFRGYTHDSGEDVAIKIFKPNTRIPAQQQLDEFKTETARVQTLGEHQNLIQIHYCAMHGSPGHMISRYSKGSTDDIFPYLVMEYAGGGTVAQQARNRRGYMPTPQVVSYLGQTAWGMMHAHGDLRPGATSRLVHRDLKPSNLLIAPTDMLHPLPGLPDLNGHGVIKIADFDLATPGLPNEETLATATAIEIVQGTWPYMAPEQFIERATHRVDIYALGVIAYELLTGRRPVSPSETSPANAIVWYQTHSEQPVRPIEEVRLVMDGVIEALQDPVMKALSKDKGDRQARMGDFYEEIAAGVRAGLTAMQRDTTHIDLNPHPTPASQPSHPSLQHIRGPERVRDAEVIYLRNLRRAMAEGRTQNPLLPILDERIFTILDRADYDMPGSLFEPEWTEARLAAYPSNPNRPLDASLMDIFLKRLWHTIQDTQQRPHHSNDNIEPCLRRGEAGHYVAFQHKPAKPQFSPNTPYTVSDQQRKQDLETLIPYLRQHRRNLLTRPDIPQQVDDLLHSNDPDRVIRLHYDWLGFALENAEAQLRMLAFREVYGHDHPMATPLYAGMVAMVGMYQAIDKVQRQGREKLRIHDAPQAQPSPHIYRGARSWAEITAAERRASDLVLGEGWENDLF